MAKTKTCYCGEILQCNNTQHHRNCFVYQQRKERIPVDHIKQHYVENYSVSKILEEINDEGFVSLFTRREIEKILKESNLYEGLNGENYLKAKVKNHVKTLKERYGVENWGQMSDGGYKKANTIPYDKISFLDTEYKQYKEQVEKITKRNTKKIEKPDYCYYTGIRFSDYDGPSNPNNPRKRSIDHKVPVIICYLNGVDAEKAASLDNIVFVLKYVNSVKSNTLHENFIPIAQKIKKVFEDEGYPSKED